MNPKTSAMLWASASEREEYLVRLRALQSSEPCVHCGGSGFILQEDFTAVYCRCRPLRKTLAQLGRHGLVSAAREKTLDNFKTDFPWQEQMLSRALDYIRQPSPGWFFAGGQSGCGKTHLCTAAAVALALDGRELHYMRWMNESARIKALSMDERRESLLQSCIDAPVLYIDDLFKSTPTEGDRRLAFELLSARYEHPDRPTIISSERTLTDLIAIDEAIAGRIAERCGASFILSIARDPGKNVRFAGLA